MSLFSASLSRIAEISPAMRKAAPVIFAVLALGPTMTAPAQAAVTCLRSRDIDSTNVVNSKTVDFRMRNGSVYRNNLRASCSSLKFSGFAYHAHGGTICDYQFVRMLQSGGACSLGAFEKMPSSATASK